MVNAVASNQVVLHHIEHVAKGTYLLPEFQRTFVWDNERVKNLWDSLYHGFPVGQLMLWVPDAPNDFPMRGLGRVQNEENPAGHTVAVIDGQQRLTALWLVLKGDIPLRFDLDSQVFGFSNGANYLRLDILKNAAQGGERRFDDARVSIFRHHASAAQREEYDEVITKCNNILNQYQMPAQTLTHADYPTVVDVFRRINQNGQPLSQAQLAMAGIANAWPGVFRRTYDLLHRLNDEVGYEQTEQPDFIFLVWTALHTGQPIVNRLYEQRYTAAQYESSWEKVQRGIDGLISLMRSIGIANFRFIRAEYPFVVAANFIGDRETGAIDQTSLARLRAWLVMSIVSGRYHIRAKSRLRFDIRATRAGREIQDLFSGDDALDPKNAALLHLETGELKRADFRSSYTSLLYMLVRRLEAEDWHCADKVGEGPRAWEFHHIFPKAIFSHQFGELEAQIEEANEEDIPNLRQRIAELNAKINSLGNLAFLTQPTNASIGARLPSDYLTELSATDRGREQLERQLIPSDPGLWRPSSFDEFCTRRCEIVREQTLRLLAA